MIVELTMKGRPSLFGSLARPLLGRPPVGGYSRHCKSSFKKGFGVVDEHLTTTWIDRLVAGDSLAAQKIWEQYYDRLVRLARQKLGGRKKRVADEEDAVVVAFNSFFQGVQQGRFPRLDDRDDLWQLLVMLTVRKTIDQIERESRQKRGGGNVQGESVFQGQAVGGINQVVGLEPTPELVVQMADRMEELLDALGDESLRDVALAKLDGFNNQEIAERLRLGLRTVERKLALVRAIWQDRGEG